MEQSLFKTAFLGWSIIILYVCTFNHINCEKHVEEKHLKLCLTAVNAFINCVNLLCTNLKYLNIQETVSHQKPIHLYGLTSGWMELMNLNWWRIIGKYQVVDSTQNQYVCYLYKSVVSSSLKTLPKWYILIYRLYFGMKL